MIFTLSELIDVTIMTLAVGYIFMANFRKVRIKMSSSFESSRLIKKCFTT